MKEQMIINKIKKGDQRTLDSFIRELYPPIYSFAYRKLQGDDIAKDITQEVFLRFVRQLPLYHCEGKTLHYLYRITSNLCHDHFRKMKREQSVDIEDKAYELSDNSSVHESILNQIQNEELMYYIKGLKEEHQDVLLLKYFHQMTFKEIADSYQLPLSTIKTRHTAALKRLSKLWKEGDAYDKP
ncbi:RNA polymerase sigma factor [Amedibacillus sp. YH-ame6]